MAQTKQKIDQTVLERDAAAIKNKNEMQKLSKCQELKVLRNYLHSLERRHLALVQNKNMLQKIKETTEKKQEKMKEQYQKKLRYKTSTNSQTTKETLKFTSATARNDSSTYA